MRDPFYCSWLRCGEGYEIIVDADWAPEKLATSEIVVDPDNRYLRPRAAGGFSAYDPMEHPEILEEFLEIGNDDYAVVRFANKWGMLLHNGPLPNDVPGEPLTAWHVRSRGLAISLKIRAHNVAPGVIETVSGDVSIGLLHAANTKIPNLVVQLHNLQSAIAALLLLKLRGALGELKRCHWCGSLFEFGPGTGRRSTSKYCSTKCKNAFHYEHARRKRNDR